MPANPRASSPDRVEREFQRGVELLADERYSEALECFERISAMDPGDPRPYHGLGKVYKALLLPERAEDAYRKAVAADPLYRPSKQSLAMLLYEGGRYREALELVEELAADAPGDPFLWAERAINELGLGKVEAAVERLRRYVESPGADLPWGHAHLGRALEAAGDLHAAEAAYRKAFELDPFSARAAYWLGHLLAARGAGEEARHLLERHKKLQELEVESHQFRMALLRDPENVPTLVGLARARFLLGKPKEALRALERARRIAPGDARLEELYENVSQAARRAGAR